MTYKGHEIRKRNQHSRHGNWEVFKDGKYCAQFHTRKEAKYWIDMQ